MARILSSCFHNNKNVHFAGQHHKTWRDACEDHEEKEHESWQNCQDDVVLHVILTAANASRYSESGSLEAMGTEHTEFFISHKKVTCQDLIKYPPGTRVWMTLG